MDAEIKTKYTIVRFSEDSSGPELVLYATVNFEWGKGSDSMALLFSITMDHFMQAEVRKHLAEPLGVDPQKDIALEDTWLMVQGFSEDEKHHTAKLVAIVRAVESEFDRMLNFLPTGPA